MLLSHTSSVQDGDGYSPFLTATYQSTNNLPSLGELLEPTGTWYTSNMYRTEAPNPLCLQQLEFWLGRDGHGSCRRTAV